MTAKFLTPVEVKHLTRRSYVVSEQHVEDRFKVLGDGFGSALFRACLYTWGCGSAATAAKLNSDVADYIENAWEHRKHFAGLLIYPAVGRQISALIMCRSQLDKLAGRGSIWIDFRAIELELYSD